MENDPDSIHESRFLPVFRNSRPRHGSQASAQRLVYFEAAAQPVAREIPRRLLTVVCEARLKIIDTCAGACSFVNNVDEFNGNVYRALPARVNTKSRAMKARKFQHGKTAVGLRVGGGAERLGTEARQRGTGEREIIARPVSSHLHSIPDGWAKSQLHFCASAGQGYYLNNSLLSKGKRRGKGFSTYLLRTAGKGIPHPFCVHAILKQNMRVGWMRWNPQESRTTFDTVLRFLVSPGISFFSPTRPLSRQTGCWITRPLLSLDH